MNNSWLWITSFVIAVICSFVSARIAGGKGHSALGFAILGFLLPLIGVIVALLLKPREASTV